MFKDYHIFTKNNSIFKLFYIHEYSKQGSKHCQVLLTNGVIVLCIDYIMLLFLKNTHIFYIQADESILIMGDEGERTRSKSGSYQLKLDLVPAHISPALAEKIFFIGESIQVPIISPLLYNFFF